MNNKHTSNQTAISEEELISHLSRQNITATYYPPLQESNQISSMLELFLILPLISFDDYYKMLSELTQISSEYEMDGKACSDIIDRYYNNIPNSPAKRYVKGELAKIRAIRNGKSFLEHPDDEIKDEEGFEEYRAIIKSKKDWLDKMKKAGIIF